MLKIGQGNRASIFPVVLRSSTPKCTFNKDLQGVGHKRQNLQNKTKNKTKQEKIRKTIKIKDISILYGNAVYEWVKTDEFSIFFPKCAPPTKISGNAPAALCGY